MRKGKYTRIFEEQVTIEELAREFYRALGYVVPSTAPRDYMEKSQHPTEIACYRMAVLASNKMMGNCEITISFK